MVVFTQFITDVIRQNVDIVCIEHHEVCTLPFFYGTYFICSAYGGGSIEGQCSYCLLYAHLHIDARKGNRQRYGAAEA